MLKRGTWNDKKGDKKISEQKSKKDIDGKAIGKIIGITAAAGAGVSLSAGLYRGISEKREQRAAAAFRKEMINQTYEVVNKSDIDRTIKQKEAEIDELNRKQTEMNSKMLGKVISHRKIKNIDEQIKNKKKLLAYLKEKIENQDYYSRLSDQCAELERERKRLLWGHSREKKELKSQIEVYRTHKETYSLSAQVLDEKINECKLIEAQLEQQNRELEEAQWVEEYVVDLGTEEKAQEKRHFILGILSLIVGIVALITLGVFIIPEVLGLIFGILALKNSAAKRGWAIAGIVTSAIALLIGIALYIL